MVEEYHGGDVADHRARAESAVQGSRLVDVVTWARDRLASLGRAAGDVVRGSYLYRWLTKEPEPEIVVIDLRETWTVGPVVRVLDRAVEWVTPHWRRSTVKSGVDRVATLTDRGLRTRPGRLLVALLEPPEPPARGPESGAVDESEAGAVNESEAGDAGVDASATDEQSE